MKRLEYSHQWIELGNNVSEKILFKTRIWFKPDFHSSVHQKACTKRYNTVTRMILWKKSGWRLTSVQF